VDVGNEELLNPLSNSRKGTRRLLSWVWLYFLHFTGLLNWARRKITKSSGIVVLTFHRVLADPEFTNTDSPAGMVVRRRTFEKLLAFLRENCDVLALSGESPDFKNKSSRPRIAITFDDGWKDTMAVAHPLAVKYGLPIAIFICPGLIGKPSPFWPEQVCRAWRTAAQDLALSAKFSSACRALLPREIPLPSDEGPSGLDRLIAALKSLTATKRDALVRQLWALATENSATLEVPMLEATMTWDESKAIAQLGARIGSHTQHHEILTRLPLDQARREIADSKLAIESQLGLACLMFAYPNGSWSEEVRDLVLQQGYVQAFINTPGIWKSDTDLWQIPRVNIWEGSLTNASGNFSSIVFQYTTFWRAYRADSKKRRTPDH